MSDEQEWPASVAMRAWPRPGRLVVRGMVTGADSAAVRQAGRDALRRLRADVLAPAPRERLSRLKAALLVNLGRARGGPAATPFSPARSEVAQLARQAAAECQEEWLLREAPLSIHVGLSNACGDVADLEWRLDGRAESLRWTCRTAQWTEDGCCSGADAITAALQD